MSTDRQMEIFELIAVHGCTQTEVGEMLDPPISQTTVNRDLKDLFDIQPNLLAVKDYLRLKDDLAPNNDPSGIIAYENYMDSDVITQF